MEYTYKQLKALKKKFDTLTYSEKLKFWDSTPGFNFECGGIGLGTYEDKNDPKPSEVISISPQNREEVELYNNWQLTHYLNTDEFNVEKYKENYFSKLTISPLPIAFTENEIAKIENYLLANKELHPLLRQYTTGYTNTVNSKGLELGFKTHNILSYAAGVRDAYYLGFLKKQLELLKQGKGILPPVMSVDQEVYFLPDKGEMQTAPAYIAAKTHLTENDFAPVNIEGVFKAKIFVPEISYLLFSDEKTKISARNSKASPFNKSKFALFYVEAFNEGEKDFDKNFAIKPDTLYNGDPELYIANLHKQFYHSNIKTNLGKGWNFWRTNAPFIITRETIMEFGYYAGFISKVLDLKEKHIHLFKNFDQCELCGEKKAIKANAIKLNLTLKQLALFLYYNGDIVTRVNANEIAKKHGHNSGEKLFQLFTRNSSHANRIGTEGSKKKNLNKLALFDIVIANLTGVRKAKAIDERKIFNAVVESAY